MLVRNLTPLMVFNSLVMNSLLSILFTECPGHLWAMASSPPIISPSVSLSSWLLALLILAMPPPISQPFRHPPPTLSMLHTTSLLAHLTLFIRLTCILIILPTPCLAAIECIFTEAEAEVPPLALPSLPWWSTLWIYPWPWMRRSFLTLNTSRPISLFEFLKPSHALPVRGLGRGCENQLFLPLTLNILRKWWLCPSNLWRIHRTTKVAAVLPKGTK